MIRESYYVGIYMGGSPMSMFGNLHVGHASDARAPRVLFAGLLILVPGPQLGLGFRV